MKLLAAVLLIAVASVQAGLSSPGEDPSWMIMPDEKGVPHVAILRGPTPDQPRLEAYVDITFFLYTKSNPVVPFQLWVNSTNWGFFDANKPVKMLMHGYNANSTSDWIIEHVHAYLRAQDVNVITVEWGGLASGPLYNVVQARTKAVGTYMGEFLRVLVAKGASSARFHCTGHSLGAHGCGIAGKGVPGMGRVTGLDAALPLYDYNVTAERLTPEDAAYVDVIHTCGGSLGFMHTLGDADFYPNEGVSSQPGCGLDVTGACSHGRSHEFFGESIESTGFVAHKCDSWADYDAGRCSTTPTSRMGEPSAADSSGLYYLRTRRNPPYAQG